MNSIQELRTYTDKVAKEGKWRGEAIEGFVVRSTVKDTSQDKTSSSNKGEGEGEPPYPAGSPFFFKIKFDEPYLMYRSWREITRTLLPLLNPKCKGRTDRSASPWTTMGQKMKRPESALYAEWCAGMMVTEPDLFDNYDKGVIRVRERFLKWTMETEEGRLKWDKARHDSEARDGKRKNQKNVKAIIVPVAVPGTGKTILGVALSKLFGIAHTQSDDITSKRTGPAFLANVEKLVNSNDVVYCDR